MRDALLGSWELYTADHGPMATAKKFKKSHPRLKFGESTAKSLRERSQPVVTCSKLTKETLEQGAKYIQS